MRFRNSLVGGALLLLAATPLAAQPTISLNYETFTLDNGLVVYLVEDHSAPVVAVDLWYHVGGANDPEGRSGFAHLFEHVMFQGTANLGKDDLLALVDDAGGTFNAYTALDRTAYHETLPAHQLPLGLWLEADRMASLAVTQTNLDNQRSVVIQEYQQNYGNAPYGLALRDFYTLTYSYGPYQRAPIGGVEDLNAATVQEIRDFHATYYVPNNATLVVAGDFDPAEARALVETYFGPIPAGDEPPALPDWQAEQQTEAAIFTIQDSLVRIPATLIGYEVPTPAHPDMAALDVLATILSGGDSSRLARDYIDTGAALVADAFLETNAGPGLFGVILLPGNVSRDELEEQFAADLARIVSEGVTQAEIDKAIALMRSGRIAGMETALGVAEAVQLGLAYYGDPEAVLNELDQIAAVTPDDVMRVAAEYLAPEDRHVFRVDIGEPQPFEEPVPFVGATGTPADDEWEVDFVLPFAEPPAPLPVTELTLPPITEVTLDNGLTVIVVEMPELPVISLDLVYRGGSSIVTGPPALSSIAAELITRGTTTRDAQTIAGTLEATGGVTGAYASGDYIGFGIFALIEERELAFDLLADMAFNPVFPENELNVQLGQLAGGLEAALGDPADQAGRAFYPVIYGDHPYGAITTLDDLGAITREAIVAYYESIARPENALLVVAGRINADEALALVEARFADWEGTGEAAEIGVPDAQPQTGLPIYLVDVPGAQQAEIRVGNIAATGTDPGRYPLSVANAVLGQGLSSRLNRILREERGYSYGVRSSLSFPVGKGVFIVSSSVQVSTVAEAIQEVINEVARLRGELIPESELIPVRDGMIGRFALNLETYQDFVNTVSSYWVRGLPLEDIAAYPEIIATVTPQLALDASLFLLPSELVVVVAGDAATLAPLLETMGEVTILQPK